MKIDLTKLADLQTPPSWLEAMELRRQAGISTTALGTQLARLPAEIDILDDLDLMTALGAALWLLARRGGSTATYIEYVSELTLKDFADAADAPAEQPPAASPNRAARRTKPKAR